MKKNSYTKLSFKRLGRTIKNSPLQFLARVLILTLATTPFSGFYASYLSLESRVSDYYEKSNMADVWTTTYTDPETITIEKKERDRHDIVDASTSYQGIVESRYYDQAKIDGKNNYICLSDTYPTICRPYETDNTDKENFFIVDRRFYEEGATNNLQVQISITSLNSFISKDSRNVKAILSQHLKPGKSNIFDGDYLIFNTKPTGRMLHPENVSFSSDVTISIFLMSRSYLNNLLTNIVNDTFNPDGWDEPTTESEQIAYELVHHPIDAIANKYFYDNQYLTKLKNRDDAVTVKNNISKVFSSRGRDENDLLLNVDLGDLESNKNISADLIQAQQMCFAFPAIFFLVAILVVSTTISQIILKERNEIGILRALGASEKSITLHYLLLECSVGLFGIVVGLILGPLILPAIMDFKYMLIYMLPARSYIFPTIAAIILTASVLAVITLVSYFTAHKEAKQLPCISMRPKVSKKNKYFAKSTITKEKGNTHRFCLKMALRNIFLSSTRSLMVILGVLGCTGLLCCGFGVDDAIQYGIRHDMNSYFNADAMVYFSSGGQETVNAIEQLVDEKLIYKYEPVSVLPADAFKVGINDNSITTQMYALNGATYKTNSFISTGDYTVHNNNIAVTSKVAKALKLKVGDYVNFYFLGKRCVGTVGTVLDSFYVQGLIIDGTWPNYPSFLTTPNIFVRYHEGADPNVVLKRLYEIKGVSDIKTHDQMEEKNAQSVSSLSYITLLIKMFAILLAAVVLYNLALLNFKENIRNVATMKVLGFTRGEIAESLIMEIMLLTAVGVVFGLAIGFPLEVLILSINKTPFNEFIYYISPLTFLYSFLITIFVSLAVNIYLGLKSKKVKMVESLKSIE